MYYNYYSMYQDFQGGSQYRISKQNKCHQKDMNTRVMSKQPPQQKQLSGKIFNAILNIQLDRNQKEQIFRNIEKLDFKKKCLGGVSIMDEKLCVPLLEHDDCILMASSVFRNGRTVLFNDEEFFNQFMTFDQDWIILMRNIIKWLTKNKGNNLKNPIKILMNTSNPNIKAISALKRASLYVQIDYHCVLSQTNLSGYDCICLGELSQKTCNQQDCQNVIKYVRNGGGLLMTFKGWSFSGYGQGKQMRDWRNECLNGKILAPMGFKYNQNFATVEEVKFKAKEIIQLQPEEQPRLYTEQQNPQFFQDYEQQNNKNHPLLFTFHGAYQAPYWNQNIHSYQDFEIIKKIDAPFFIIESKRINLIGRTQKIFPHLNINIKRLCDFWNTVIGHYKNYSGMEQHPFEKQGYFSDANIMLGYMHSANPIMTHEDTTFQMLGVGEKLFHDGKWGFYHELGHNHQDYKWTIPQMDQVTCNIFELYLGQMMHGFTIQKYLWRNGETQKKVREYFSKP